MTRFLIAAVLAAACCAALPCSAAGLQTADNAPAFKLADQFGKVWELAKLKNSVVVVVAANRESGRLMGPWVDNLKGKYGSKIQLLGLMDLHGLAGIFHGMARSRIKKETQDPLMIDFDGATGKAYEVSDKYPVVVVIDRGGVVRAIGKTAYTQDTLKPIAEAIDKALKPSGA